MPGLLTAHRPSHTSHHTSYSGVSQMARPSSRTWTPRPWRLLAETRMPGTSPGWPRGLGGGLGAAPSSQRGQRTHRLGRKRGTGSRSGPVLAGLPHPLPGQGGLSPPRGSSASASRGVSPSGAFIPEQQRRRVPSPALLPSPRWPVGVLSSQFLEPGRINSHLGSTQFRKRLLSETHKV